MMRACVAVGGWSTTRTLPWRWMSCFRRAPGVGGGLFWATGILPDPWILRRRPKASWKGERPWGGTARPVLPHGASRELVAYAVRAGDRGLTGARGRGA